MANYYNSETVLWLNGEFVKASEAKIDLYSQSLHYGYAVFEGIRSYKTVSGETKIFKPEEHYDRLRNSALAMNMPYTWSNEELIKYLSQIKGVGQWTVEMILMFTLGREDIFAVDDLGIQQAVCKLYKINSEDKKAMKEKMLSVSKKWSPYRTYACRYLWGWKDNVPQTPSAP